MDEKQKSEDILKIAKTDDQHVLPIETIEMNKPVEIKYDIVNNRDISLKILLKELIFEGLSETSLHGLPKVMKNNYHIALRVLWLIAFLTSTVITTKYVQEIPTQFPAVSFCNMKNPDKSRVYTQDLFANLTALNIFFNYSLSGFPSPAYLASYISILCLTIMEAFQFKFSSPKINWLSNRRYASIMQV